MAAFVDSLQGNDAAIEVVVGQSRLLTTRVSLASPTGTGFIAVSDPTVLEFEVLPDPHMIRIAGRRAGVTDLSIVTPEGQSVNFEIRVVYDLDLLRAHLRSAFPDAALRLGQLREHIIVEGQARSPAQVDQISRMLQAYLDSVQTPQSTKGQASPQGTGAVRPLPRPPVPGPNGAEGSPSDYQGYRGAGGEAMPEYGGDVSTEATYAKPRIINLIRVPGVQQVLLQVRIAELDRTGLREVGADILAVDPSNGNIFGTSIAGSTVQALATLGLGGLVGTANTENGPSTTAVGIFPSGDWEILLRLLRRNSLVKVLAEPNLVALNGSEASFLAGGQFPVPVAQGGFTSNSVTVEWKDFGVQLNFTPYIQEDESIRLVVTPEVSTIDRSLGTVLVVGGTPVPGVNVRRATTTVQMREGETLAIGGVLQTTVDAQTSRIPFIGDLPIIGPLFSSTNHEREERELLVIVTPFLVRPMHHDQVPPLPGDDVSDPTDCEFYFQNLIEGRQGSALRARRYWDTPNSEARPIPPTGPEYIPPPAGVPR